MATLLLIILKSGDAVRAFVDALFIMNSFLAEQMLRCQIKCSVIETGNWSVEQKSEYKHKLTSLTQLTSRAHLFTFSFIAVYFILQLRSAFVEALTKGLVIKATAYGKTIGKLE